MNKIAAKPNQTCKPGWKPVLLAEPTVPFEKNPSHHLSSAGFARVCGRAPFRWLAGLGVFVCCDELCNRRPDKNDLVRHIPDHTVDFALEQVSSDVASFQTPCAGEDSVLSLHSFSQTGSSGQAH